MAVSPARSGRAGGAIAAIRPLEPVPRQSPRRRLVLALCCATQLMVILDVAMVTVALPSIAHRFELSVTALQWVVNAFVIGCAAFMMLGSRAAAVFGIRRTLVFGLLVFSVASVAGGLAESEAWLIAARAVQGVGAAIVIPASLATLATAVGDGAERRRELPRWGAALGAGAAAGVVLGGTFSEVLSWRWVFFVNVPIAIAAAGGALGLLRARERRSRARRGFDLPGSATLTATLVLAALGLASTSTKGLAALTSAGPLALAVVLLAAFCLIEARAGSAPPVSRGALASRVLRTPSAATAVLTGVTLAMWFFVSIYLQQVLRLSPIGAGLAFLPMGLTVIACAGLAGRVSTRLAPGRLLGFGLVLVALGMAAFSRIRADGGYVADVVVPGLIVSLGVGISLSASLAATARVPPTQAGLAATLLERARVVGAALGLALLVSVAISHANDVHYHAFIAPAAALTDGLRRGFEVGAVFALVGAIAAYRLSPRVRASSPAGPAGQARR